MHTFIHCSFHQHLAVAGTYSIGENINYVQISSDKAEVRCSRGHMESTVLLISLLREGLSLL